MDDTAVDEATVDVTAVDDGAGFEVLIGHMGGPFWAGRESAAWSIPKGSTAPRRNPRPPPAGSSRRSSAVRRRTVSGWRWVRRVSPAARR